jgi:hypothetical protein
MAGPIPPTAYGQWRLTDGTLQTLVAGTVAATADTSGNQDFPAAAKLSDGGTVTQGTSKSTTVVLNTHTGQITLHAAALAAGVEVTFTVTNSTVGAADVVVLNHGSAGTAGSYLVGISAVASGSFKATVSNASGGSLSEAIVLNFAVIGGSAT